MRGGCSVSRKLWECARVLASLLRKKHVCRRQTACLLLLRACSSRRSINAFFAGFLLIAHGIHIAASVVGLCRGGTRPEIGEHLRISALCAGSAIEICQG